LPGPARADAGKSSPSPPPRLKRSFSFFFHFFFKPGKASAGRFACPPILTRPSRHGLLNPDHEPRHPARGEVRYSGRDIPDEAFRHRVGKVNRKCPVSACKKHGKLEVEIDMNETFRFADKAPLDFPTNKPGGGEYFGWSEKTGRSGEFPPAARPICPFMDSFGPWGDSYQPDHGTGSMRCVEAAESRWGGQKLELLESKRTNPGFWCSVFTGRREGLVGSAKSMRKAPHKGTSFWRENARPWLVHDNGTGRVLTLRLGIARQPIT